MDFEETNFKDRLNALCEFYDQYEYVKIRKTTQGQAVFFEADSVTKGSMGYLIFSRRFADSVVTDSPVVKIEVTDGIGVVWCGEDVFTIYPGTLKKDLPTSDLPSKFHIDELMTTSYIDEKKVSSRNGVVYAPISLRKLGRLSKEQLISMNNILARLGGLAVRTQCRRVPAFSVELMNNGCVINGCIYNLEKDSYIGCTELYNSDKHSFIKAFDAFARDLWAMAMGKNSWKYAN